MEDERLEQLLSRYFNQLITPQERAELERMLLASPEARESFWAEARLNSALRQWGQEEFGRRDAAAEGLRVLPGGGAKPRTPTKPVPRRQQRLWPVGLAAVAAITMGLGFFAITNRPGSRPSAGMAVVTRTFGVVWAEGGALPEGGKFRETGWLRLKGGALQVEFARGARVVLEGPAEFQINSDNAGFLKYGKLTANVPAPAHGFEVKSANFVVIDYGTEFGCSVPEGGKAELHVFEGKVGLQAEAAGPALRELTENHAVRFDLASLEEIPADPSAFIDEEELARRDRVKVEDQLTAWRQSRESFVKQPNLLLYLDFERPNDWTRTLANLAANAPAHSEAAVVGSAWVEGRAQGKGGLEFKRPEDRVRTTLAGSYDDLTFAAWIRVDRLKNRLNGIVMGENTEMLGETQWYVYSSGALGVAVRIAPRKSQKQWLHAQSNPVFHDDTMGVWTHVATVVERSSRKVTHFVNGLEVSSMPFDAPPPMRLGTLEIGNWGLQEQSTVEPGNFEGRIDEVAIFSRALSPVEISKMYEDGRPARD